MDSNEIYTQQTKWYESSNGKGDLSATVRGMAVAFIPLIISILRSQGMEITEDQVAQVIEQLFTFVSVSLVLFGTVRKGYYFLRK